MTELMMDDVCGQAREDAPARTMEIIELQGFALPVVVGVLAGTGVRNDDQPIALESPRNQASEAAPAFKELQSALHEGPCVHLVELKQLRIGSVEKSAGWSHERAAVRVPAGGRRRAPGV